MMEKIIVGVNLPDGTALSGLDAMLARLVADGFDAVEINLATCPLIIGGKLQKQVAEYMKGVLAKYPVQYTAHVGYGLDLRNLEEMDMHRAVMFASIDACAELGLNPLNFHFEEQSKFMDREAAFLENMAQAAQYAQEKGVRINMENIEVEHAMLAADAVRKINHPNLGMTLDLGHLYISAKYFGYDFMETVRACAPLVRHLHINDNVGIFEPMRLKDLHVYNTMSKGYRFAFGRGDIHIPPLWGEVPLREAFSELKKAGYNGVWLCEYYSQPFHPLGGEIRQAVYEAILQA